MELLLIRHAIAEEPSPQRRDEARTLTPEGRDRFVAIARGLRRLGVRLDRLYHSPWTRAVETADLLAALVDGETVVEPGLAAPPARPLLARLEGERIALVGHEPWLSELAAWLVFGRAELHERIDLRKGGVIWLEGEPRPGEMALRALLPPKITRRVR